MHKITRRTLLYQFDGSTFRISGRSQKKIGPFSGLFTWYGQWTWWPLVTPDPGHIHKCYTSLESAWYHLVNAASRKSISTMRRKLLANKVCFSRIYRLATMEIR